MSLIKRLSSFLVRWRWFAGAAVVILSTSSVVFDSYIRHTGLEIVNGWLQNEAIAIQQGNLLSSITKNQRILLSSDFIRGIKLVDRSRPRFQELIAFGDRFTEPSAAGSGQEPVLHRAGLFRYVVGIPIEQSPQLHLEFLIAPFFASTFFFAYSFSLIGLILVFIYRANRAERLEAEKRNELLHLALNDFAFADEPSPMIKSAAPKLIERWNELKARLQESQQREIQLASSARFADLARQVSHDIRSPLTALKMAARTGLPPETSMMIQSVVKRIDAVAEMMLAQTRGSSCAKTIALDNDKHPSQRVPPLVPISNTEAISLPSQLAQIIAEKKLEMGPSGHIISFRQNLPYTPIAHCNSNDLQRVLSNLINNSIEALTPPGRVDIALQTYRDSVAITIADNGKGIPADVLPLLFKSGASFGKANGNGLGLSSAKTMVEGWGGKLDLVSKEGLGTIVTIQLKRADVTTPSPTASTSTTGAR